MTGSGLIEAAGPVHAAALALIHAGSFPAGEQWGVDAIRLQLGLHGGFGLLDARGAMLLARCVADEAEVLTVAVLPVLRRQGIGRMLLEAAKSEAARRGAVQLFLEVSIANVAAQALYARAGFRQVGRRRQYYADGSDALILRCDVTCVATTTG